MGTTEIFWAIVIFGALSLFCSCAFTLCCPASWERWPFSIRTGFSVTEPSSRRSMSLRKRLSDVGPLSKIWKIGLENTGRGSGKEVSIRNHRS